MKTYFGDVFEQFGFTPHVTSGKTRKPLVLSNFNSPGITIHLDQEKHLFRICGGNIMYFGEITYPWFSLKGRKISELEDMLNKMRHYIDIIDKYGNS